MPNTNKPSYNPADKQDLAGILKMWQENIFRQLRVCLPAVIADFDKTAHTATVTPAITMQTTGGESLTLPNISNVPVCAAGGGGYVASFPLQKGDTGWLIFADRDISIFKQNGVVSPANTYRKHNLADAIFIPDVMGKANISDSGAVWQTLDGSVKAVLSQSGLSVKGDISINGSITVTGTVTASVDVVAGGISLKEHIHGGVTGGSGTTGVAQ